MRFDVTTFLQAYKDRFGAPNAEQSQGLAFLLDRVANDAGFTVLRHVAYMLATIKWESGQTFQPVKEKRARQGRSEAQDKVFAAQQKYWDSGFYGRGYVQITWDSNYRNAGNRLQGVGVTGLKGGGPQSVTIQSDTFVTSPDLVLEPPIAYLIAAHGMRDGWFRSRKGGPPFKLSDFVQDAGPTDYRSARNIINSPSDNADVIADYANRLELALRASLSA